ncbi:MAG: 4-hydroxyphenylpyruvate dioxygenase [Candidatus Eisenbacteria bacterium]
MFRGIDHLEFYVGNALTSAYYFERALGFRRAAEAGLETGARDCQSYVLTQGSIRLVFTNPIGGGGPIAERVHAHGDGIHDIAFLVDDVAHAFERCLVMGATAIREPFRVSDETGEVRCAKVGTFGFTEHSLIERRDYAGAFLPGYRAVPAVRAGDAALSAIDHVACCVEPGTLDRWIDFYSRLFEADPIHRGDIVTERSAMNSKVVGSADRSILLPLMEPAPGRGKSQIAEFLDYHHGAGAQHIAFLSHDILASVRAWREGGIELLPTPAPYYDALPARIGALEEPVDALRQLDVLVDRDAWGYLLQVFSRPITGRPTSFLEVIERKGARGFGDGNVRALFEAVERAQAARGNL